MNKEKEKNTIRTLSPKIRAACLKDEFYYLLSPWGCGASDGGCLMVALALQNILGGELYGLTALADRRCKIARYEHAVLKIGNLYIDSDGVASSQMLITRWKNYSNLLEICNLVPLLDKDEMTKRGTPYCEQTTKKLAEYFYILVTSSPRQKHD